jgi:UDP:flavonoid glycosyltransferase YjiC (YdhE family)
LAVERALSRPQLRERAAAVARWAAEHDGATTAAEELERWMERSGRG